MTSVADLISDTRRHLYGTHRAEYNKLAIEIDTLATTLTFTYDLKGLVAGAIIAIEDELLYVWSTTPASKMVVVERAWMGTTVASHAASTVVEVAPRFPQDSIRDALLAEIRSWGDTIYQIDTYSLSVSSTTSAYDLPIDPFYEVLDVRRSDSGSATWATVANEVVRHAPTGSFSSGQAIQIRQPLPTTATVQVVFSKPLNLVDFDNATDLELDIGLETSMFDIPPLGAAWRLLAPREIKRTFTESKGEERDNKEVPAGHITQTATSLKRLRDERLDQEAARLRARVAWKF